MSKKNFFGMTGDTVKLIIEASGGKGASVTTDDFLRQIGAVIAALKETAKAIEGEKSANIRYRVVGLGMNSPATVDFRAEMVEFSEKVNFPTIHGAMVNGLDAILTGDREIPPTVTAGVFRCLKDFCAPIGGSVSTTRFVVNGVKVDMDLRFKSQLSKIQAKDIVEKGMFMKGMIETANIHDAKRSFYLYPLRGPEKVRCVFAKSDKEKVKKSFGKYVRVHGDFKFEWREKYPYEIAVKEIEMLPFKDELPDIRKIWGAAPNATGKLSTEEFVEHLRYG